MATILMAELLHLTNIILPPGYSSDAHCLPDLIASAMDFNDLMDQRKCAKYDTMLSDVLCNVIRLASMLIL